MLTPDARARATDRLRLRRRELETEVRAKLAATREVAGVEAVDRLLDGGDFANADLLAALDIAEVERDMAEMRDVDAALRRITDGRYGRCTDCGIDIPPARLQAQPTALRCAPCQSLAERRSGQTRAGL